MPSWKYYSSPFTVSTAIETQLSERFFLSFDTWSSGSPVKIHVWYPLEVHRPQPFSQCCQVRVTPPTCMQRIGNTTTPDSLP